MSLHQTAGTRPDVGPPPAWGASVLAATDRLLAAARVEEFAAVFQQAIGDDHGALPRLHQFLESAASWCHDHGAHHSAAELDALAARLAELGEDLLLLPDQLAAETTRRAARTAVAQAALRSSPAVGTHPAATASPAAPTAPNTTPTTAPTPAGPTVRRSR